MTQTQMILAGVAFLLWVMSSMWFFRAELAWWVRVRVADRAGRQDVMSAQLAQQARMIDDIARRYPAPAVPGRARA
jgi:hypothetical protein